MSVGRICSRDVDLVDANESVREAARRMLSRVVGTLVVLDSDRRPIGLVTDRDLALRVLAEGRDPEGTPVEAVMTRHPKTIAEDAPIESALTLMTAGTFRRLLVVNREGKLEGLLSLDDVLALLAEEFGSIGRLLLQARSQTAAIDPPAR